MNRAVPLVLLLSAVSACSLPYRTGPDGQRHPIRVGVLTAPTESRCRPVVVSGEVKRVCVPRSGGEEPRDTVAADPAATDTVVSSGY